MTPPDNSTHAMAMAAARAVNQVFGDVFTSTEEKRVAVIISEHFATLQKDKERLDWIANPDSPISLICLFPSYGWDNQVSDSVPPVCERLREAIDAAMQPPQ